MLKRLSNVYETREYFCYCCQIILKYDDELKKLFRHSVSKTEAHCQVKGKNNAHSRLRECSRGALLILFDDTRSKPELVFVQLIVCV